MRAVLHQDLVALARCLMLLPESRQRGFARRKILLAHKADEQRLILGRSDPKLGDGTLSSAVNGCPKGGETPLDRAPYGKAFAVALAEVLRFREAHPLVHETQRGTAGSMAKRPVGNSSPQSVQ